MNNISNLDHKKDIRSYRKVAVAACFGTFLEWYDFLTFATLAVVFAPLFFPSSDPNTGLLASLATFGVGMVVFADAKNKCNNQNGKSNNTGNRKKIGIIRV